MSSLKKFVREEVNNALIKESARIEVKEMQKNLYEVVKTMNFLKNKITESKSELELKINTKGNIAISIVPKTNIGVRPVDRCNFSIKNGPKNAAIIAIE